MREFQRFPIPSPFDLSDPVSAQPVFDELVELVDQFVAPNPHEEGSGKLTDSCLQEIDRLIYLYFGLNEDEVELVEETMDQIIPATHPSQDTYPAIWLPTVFSDRLAYSMNLQERLSGWFDGEHPPTVRMYARDEDYSILEVTLDPDATVSYTEFHCKSFPAALAELALAVRQPVSGNFCVRSDIRLLVRDKLYLIKPLQKRFWLCASAVCDSGSIMAELEALRQRSRMRRIVQ